MNDIKVPDGKPLERSTAPPRKPQDLLNMHNAEIAVTPPPSYDAVLLQKHSERLLQPTDAPLHSVAEYLRELDSLIPPTTAETSEKRVQKYLTALSELGDTCTLAFARKAPEAVIENVRQFLLHCVARDSGVDSLITLPEGQSLHFVYLQTAYEWSWRHQIEHGWEDTPRETQLWAYETFHLFIELPLRHLGVPISAFLWHTRVHTSVYRLPQGSSLFERPPRFLCSTLQAMRSHGELNRLEELLRMNDMILDSVVDGLHSHPKIFRACKKEIADERRTSILPEMRSNKFQYTMVEHPEWRRFERINRNRTSEFAPLRPRKGRKGDPNDKTRTASGPKLERLPDFSAMRHELEYNPWS
jgi:hypothetical protein